MVDENDEPQFDEEPAAAIESEGQDQRAEPSLEEDAEKLIKNAAPVLRKLRLNPDMAERAGEGFRALRGPK